MATLGKRRHGLSFVPGSWRASAQDRLADRRRCNCRDTGRHLDGQRLLLKGAEDWQQRRQHVRWVVLPAMWTALAISSCRRRASTSRAVSPEPKLE